MLNKWLTIVCVRIELYPLVSGKSNKKYDFFFSRKHCKKMTWGNLSSDIDMLRFSVWAVYNGDGDVLAGSLL